MRCTAFFGVRRDFIGGRGKTPCRGIFARLVTNNIFVIVVTLIITFSIWIVKNCHQALYRYSQPRTSPCTIAVLPLFFLQNIPQHHSPSDTISNTCQFAIICRSVKILTSFCFRREHTQAGQHTTLAGKDSHSIMVIIIIMISIRWIYILKNTHKNTV